MPLVQLILNNQDILGKVDASKHSAGGLWQSATHEFLPLVQQYKLPGELKKNLEVQLKGNTNATNSDYKALSFIIIFLILEEHINVRHKHIVLYYDNILTISWVQKLSSKSKHTAQLMQVLALRMKANDISPIVFLSITRYLNKEVDFASRIFRDSKSCPLSLYKFV